MPSPYKLLFEVLINLEHFPDGTVKIVTVRIATSAEYAALMVLSKCHCLPSVVMESLISYGGPSHCGLQLDISNTDCGSNL